MKTLTLIGALALSGCATCQNHPMACGIAGAIVVGSIAATLEHQHDVRYAHASQKNLCGVIGSASIPGHQNDCAEIGR